MRENNRKPIEKCIKKLPQFTTMNVIDGQAGLVIYSSLIFYSLTIDNILNIIVLLILAGVSIAMLTGENGILTQAQKAKDETEKAEDEEKNILDQLEDVITEGTGGGYLKTKGVNSPKLVQGMKKIMFTLPTTDTKGSVVEEGQSGFDENNWYDYKTSKWANTMTEDGSMWVWIPRFAYKITYKTGNKSDGGTIDVKFLIGTTDQYYDDEGNLQTAKRATSATEAVDTTSDYYVHPAFTDESDINYANGGWDSELTGIWVAKFEAGYASGNNDAEVVASSVNYTQTTAWVPNVETTKTDTNGDGAETDVARNWLDGVYGTNTSIKYPTFQPTTYSMNYINVNDANNISRALTGANNIYGFSSSSTDSHLMKNSEWGAVAYLGWSQYGAVNRETKQMEEPYINNITAESGNTKRGDGTNEEGKTGLTSVYAITGLTTGTTDAEEVTMSSDNLNEINSRTGNTGTSNNIYAWDQATGQKSSSTLNMYGVYDLSGGTWERTAAYVNNGHENLSYYGSSVVANGDTSTKYATVYPHDATVDDTDKLTDIEENLNTASNANYPLNKYIFGDAVRETSTSGTGTNSWNSDYSYFPGLDYPFFVRGGYYWVLPLPVCSLSTAAVAIAIVM